MSGSVSCMPTLRRRSTGDQAGIESEVDFADDPELSQVGVSWIDQEIAFGWNDGRRYTQEAAVSAVEPSISDSLQRSRRWVLAPIAGQVSHREFSDFDTLGDEDLDRYEINRKKIGVAVDEDFEPGKGEGLGCIGNQTASGMPASRNEEPASAVERRACERPARETNESH
jgi:hypothetical protein